jgi:hypothetical protein
MASSSEGTTMKEAAVMDRARLDSNIEAIRRYRDANPELRLAHHFVYDLPLNKYAGQPEVIVMGMNPGETQYDRDACPGPTEETWNLDFHEKPGVGRSQGSVNWRRNAEFFAQGKSVVFTELFFWSSNDQRELNERFGPLWRSRHLRFCVDMNRSLLDCYEPKFVIFVGVSYSMRVAQEFGLRFIDSLKEHSHRLVDHYEDEHRPWFFTRHWSGSFGFSRAQKEQIRTYIQNQTK